MDSANAFIEKVKTNDTLLSELADLSEKKDAEGMAELMRANGVSEKEIAGLIHLDRSAKDELSNKELEEVSAGGFWEFTCNGVYLLTKLGK